MDDWEVVMDVALVGRTGGTPTAVVVTVVELGV